MARDSESVVLDLLCKSRALARPSPMTPDPPQANVPREPLTRHRVLVAAVQLADGAGIAALSMRKLAQSLGVEAMSLYHHVKSKEDLLDGMVEIVAAEFEAPSLALPWREAMTRRAHAAHRTLLAHPWATALIVSRINTGPVMLRYVDATIGCLTQAGFSLPLADRAWNAIDSHVYGFTLQELNFPFEPGEYASVASSYLPEIPVDELPNLHALTVEVAEGRHDGLQDFDLGLTLILGGLEALRGPA